MKLHLRGALGLLFLAALTILPASAELVTYSTVGAFSSCSAGYTCAGNVLTGPGSLTITYSDTNPNTVDVPPVTNASFGLFTVTGPTTGVDSVLAQFNLTINQTTPSAGTETLGDSFQGNIKVNNSQVVLEFTTGSPISPALVSNPFTFAPAYSFSFGNVTYYVNKFTPINPSTTNGGRTTINGAITAVTTPDGGMTVMLLGGALAMVASVRRKLKA